LAFCESGSDWRAHLTQELEHALVLAEQIDFLGEVPSNSPRC
jgi:hypothetical protein